MGRSKGRARRHGYELEKAYSRGAAAAMATANRGAQPRTVALGDAINALTGGPGRTNGLVIDDETRWMMRDPRDDVAFGPINPLRPDAIDPLRPDTKRPEPRLTEYPVAWNLPGSADAPMPWATLRAAAQNVDIMRRCISVRQEQLQGLDWSITLDDQIVQGMHAASTGDTGREDIEAELRRKLLPEIDRLTTFWRNPWKANGVSFEQWVNGIMEDHLVLDAVAIYPRMTYGGELSAFELIDATTIKLLVDYRGARPVAPFPAFQQILYGFPRAEFGSCYAADGDGDVKPVDGMSAGQLFYFREQYRSFTPYGYSAVAQALISARLYLRRQGWMLAEYDDGSTPLTFLVPDATDGTMVEALTPRTRRQWEDSINAELAGQTRARNRMKVLMPGMTPHQMQGVDERYKPDYDMHLIKMLAGHFGVTSSGLGFSESRGLGNSGLHEGQADVQQAATTKPDKRMIERIVNELMCTYQGAPAELRFKFTDPDTEDQAAEDASANAQRARGTITLNDDRKRIGKSPFTFAEADMPMALLGTGWVPIEGMAERAQQQADAEQALVDDQLANSESQRDMAAVEAEEVPADQVDKALELAAYNRWRRKRGGDARRSFICKSLEPSDWPGEQVPDDVDFAEWVWVADGQDIDKAANDNWRTLARDGKGRWVKRGSMRVDALGPSTPDKPVLAGLARDAERRRAAAARKPEASARAAQASRNRADAAVSRMLRETEAKYGSDRAQWPVGKLGMAAREGDEQARAVIDARRDPDAYARRTAAEHFGATQAAQLSDDEIRARNAEEDRQVERERLLAAEAARMNARRQLPVSDSSSTMGGMTSPKAPKITPAQQKTLDTMAAMGDKPVYYNIAGQRGINVNSLPALERAGLIERVPNRDPEDWKGDEVRLVQRGDGRRKLTSEQAMTPAGQRYGAALNARDDAAERLAYAERVGRERGRGTSDYPDAKARLERAEADLTAATAALDAVNAPRGAAKHSATWNGETVSVNSSRPFTHAAVVRWGDGTESVHSFHESAEGAARGNLAASQKRGGARVVGVAEVRREDGAAADAAVTAPAATAPKAGAPGARRFSVTLPDGTVQTSPSTKKDVRTAVVVTTDNAALAASADADAERRRRAGDAAGAARYDAMAAGFRARPAQEHRVHWSTSDKPGVRRHSFESEYERAQVIAATEVVDAPRAAVQRGERGPDEGQRMAALDRADSAAAGVDVAASRARFARRAPAKTPEQVDQDVRDVVTELQDAPGGWVSMVDVRRKLDERDVKSRADQDAAIRRLMTTGDRALNAAPEDNQKTLGDEEHAAAIDLGAGPQHVLSLDPPRRSMLDTVRESSEQAAAARAVIDSVPGLREGVARQQGEPRTDRRPRIETYKGRKLKVQKHPRLEGRLLLTINGEMAGTPYAGRPEQMDRELEQLRRDVDAADLRRHQDPNAYPEHMFRGAPKPTAEETEHARAYWAREAADRAAMDVPLRSTSADDPELTTVREEGRQNNPGYALPGTPPAARAEAIAASTPDAPSAAPALSRKQRDMAERFDRLAGEHAADPAVAQMRARAVELAGEAERINRGDEDAPNAWVVQGQMQTVQHEFTHAMAGARAAAAARADGADARAQGIARTRATLDSRARRVTDRIRQLEDDLKASAKPRGSLSDPHADARKKLRTQISDAKAERQRYLDRIERAERDHDTKLTYDANGRLVDMRHEPPTAPAAAPTIESMMAANMAASTAAAPAFGAQHGKLTNDQVKRGDRVQFNGATWEVLETPRRAQRNNVGKEGKLFRARREDQGFEGTIRLNDGESIAVAAPREQLKADDDTFARIADRLRSARDDAAARKSVNSLSREGLAGVARSLGIDPAGMKLAELRAAIVAARGGK